MSRYLFVSSSLCEKMSFFRLSGSCSLFSLRRFIWDTHWVRRTMTIRALFASCRTRIPMTLIGRFPSSMDLEIHLTLFFCFYDWRLTKSLMFLCLGASDWSSQIYDGGRAAGRLLGNLDSSAQSLHSGKCVKKCVKSNSGLDSWVKAHKRA